MNKISSGGISMYELKVKERFIIIKVSDIIEEKEAVEICERIYKLLEERNFKHLILDARKLDLKNSCLDVFINYLTNIKFKKVALILENLLSKFKFNLWSRKYRPQINIQQFKTKEQAENWLQHS